MYNIAEIKNLSIYSVISRSLFVLRRPTLVLNFWFRLQGGWFRLWG